MSFGLGSRSLASVRCAHCGFALSPPARGAVVHCPRCRGWSLLGNADPAALMMMRVTPRRGVDAAIGELRRQTEQAGLGEPHVLDTRTEWITYFARAGTMRAIVRNNGARSDKQWQGFLAIPLGGDPRLPLEVLEPSMLEEAAALDDNPEISLDDFDAIVRQKVGHQLRSEALAGGFTPFDIDLHPFWKAEVCLVHLPLQRIEFSLTPPLGMFEKLEPRGTRSYGALVGLHDGRTKIIDLPRIKRFADLGMAVGLGMGLLVLVGLALVVIVVVLAVLSS